MRFIARSQGKKIWKMIATELYLEPSGNYYSKVQNRSTVIGHAQRRERHKRKTFWKFCDELPQDRVRLWWWVISY
jgi:hypothetical protein